MDALRFEMGVELKNLLAGSEDLVLRPAIAALPTITRSGDGGVLATVLPRGSTSSRQTARWPREIEGVALKDVAARMKFLKFRVPGAVDIELGKLLQMTSGKLKNAIGDAKLVVVRSQEIDKFGEMDGDFIARQMMDTVLQNVARAVRKLAGAGIESVVITADHGYQFTREKDEAFRTDNPGGETIDLHRRCWVGPGRGQSAGDRCASPGRSWGTTPTSTSSSPQASGSSAPGASLAYHHGGISLQEMVIPVLTLRTAAHPGRGIGRRVEREGRAEGPEQPHVRRDDRVRRPVRGRAGGRAAGADGRRGAGRRGGHGHGCPVRPGIEDRDRSSRAGPPAWRCCSDARIARPIRIAVLDPATDAVLVQSEDIPVRLGI